MSEFIQIAISEIGNTITGKTPSLESNEDFGKEFMFITPSDDFNSKYIYKTIRFLSEIGLKKLKSKALPPNSILVSCIGSAMGKVLMNGSTAITNQQINAIIPSENFHNDYVYYKLKNSYQLLRTAASGSTSLPLLNKTDFDLIKLNLHKNKLKQAKIAFILSRLDDKIELNNQINDNLERMAKTLYDYWFVQFDFPDEYGKPYKSSGGKMIWNETLKREIPEGWAIQTIEALGTITGGSTPSKASGENFSKNGIPWITPKDLSQNLGNKFIARGELDVTEKGLRNASLNILPAYSVLMSSRAPIGYLAINRIDCTTNQGFKSIICNKKYPFEYVFYVLKQNMISIEANASGSTFKEISASVLKTIKILKPQIHLIKQFKNNISVIFQQQNNLEQQNQQLSSLRDWLLPMLMNGQVKVE